MARIVSLRLDDRTYRKLRRLAEQDNRPLSNFIETAALRLIESEEFVDEFEMEEIRGNAALTRSLRRGLRDARSRRGRFA